MKQNAAVRGRRPTRQVAVRKIAIPGKSSATGRNTRRRSSRSRHAAMTKLLMIVTTVLLVGLTLTILYTQFYKKEVDRLFAKKYSLVNAAGEKNSFTEEELKKEVDIAVFYPGIRIDGVDVSGKSLDEAKAMFQSTRTKHIDDVLDVSFQVGDDKIKLKTDGMTLSSNIDEVLIEAYNYGKTSQLEGVDGLIERYNLMTELQKTPKDYYSSFTIGDNNVSTLAHEALDEYNQSPREAKAIGFDVSKLEFVIEDSQSGQSVDIEKAISEVKAAFAEKNFSVVIPVEVTEIKPETTADSLRSKLGRVSSNSSKTTDDENRNTNIYLVCKTIDGLVLQPGEQFDFNRIIGERTEEKGYKEATGILDGAPNKEYGGGICQANTMLYHSVMEADLRVDSRTAHSWPSDYVDKGTDATVSWEEPDFKFTNNTDYPVAIHAYYGDRWVTVEIFGRLLPDGQYIRFFGNPDLLVDEAPTKTDYVADSTLPVGEVVKVRSPHNHILAEAYKVTYDKDGNELKRETIQTEYRLINGKYRVGTLASDGTVFYMDPDTGEVSAPAGYVPPTQATEPPPETTEAPADTTEAPPPETQADPPETQQGGEGGSSEEPAE